MRAPILDLLICLFVSSCFIATDSAEAQTGPVCGIFVATTGVDNATAGPAGCGLRQAAAVGPGAVRPSACT